MDDAQLRTIWQQKQLDDRIIPLSHSLGSLMKYTLAKRVKQLRNFAKIWDELIPDFIREHTALESFDRGVLTVMVDSASHRFHLQKLLNGGLMRQIQARFVGPLNRVKLVPGQFYAVDIAGNQRFEF